MFKFDFINDEHQTTELDTSQQTETDKTKECDKKWLESKEILPSDLNPLFLQQISNCEVNVVTLKNTAESIKYVSCSDVLINLINDDSDLTDGKISKSILSAEENHSDLESAVYEGGLKIWECTYDLLKYLDENTINLNDKNVLDLGCGAGIIGIFTLLNGSKTCFQDYNEEVIKYLTVSNVVSNDLKSEKNFLQKSTFFSGDWTSFSEVLNRKDDIKFDFILTCETIYNEENYIKLLRAFERLLHKDGIIYLAAKSYYFGVGGSTSEFRKILDKENIFKSKLVWKSTEGLQREIIEICFK